MTTRFTTITSALLISSAAFAADLPARSVAPEPVFAPVSAYSWTGFYAGVQAGWSFGENETTLLDSTGVVLDVRPLGIDPTVDFDGFVGGAHVGYNHQFGSFVLGAEADLEYSAAESSLRITSAALPGFLIGMDNEITWQGSLRARIGAAFDRTLVYATGGLAFAQIESTLTGVVPAPIVVGPGFTLAAGTYSESSDRTAWGWTVGAGVAHAFTENLSGRIEYRYTEFDDEQAVSTLLSPGDLYRNDPHHHTIRAGLSYKF